MKIFLVLLTALAIGGGNVFAKGIPIGKLPAKILNVIDDHVPHDKLDRVSVKLSTDGNRYVAKLNLKDGKTLRIDVSRKGKLIKVVRPVKLKEVPKKVRSTMDDFLDLAGEAVDIERVTLKDGKVTYVVTIRIEGEDDFIIIVSEDGTLLQGDEELDFTELSKHLRTIIHELLGDSWIVGDIHRVTVDGETTYQLSMESEEFGARILITMDEAGNIIDEETEFFGL